MTFSPDGKFIVTESADNWFRFWRTATGKPLCALSHFDDGSWAVVDPEGRYDASDTGDTTGMHWVMGITPIDLNQFKDGFYEPGLLPKLLGFNKEPLRNIPLLAGLKLFPKTTIAPIAGGQTTMVSLTNRDKGGIGPVAIWINGKEWKSDARPPKFDPQAQQLEIPLDLNSALIRPGELNTLRVVSHNAARTLASPASEVRWTAPGTPEPFAPRMYAIVCGISQYANPKKIKNLRFAAKDARDMAHALTVGARKLFGADQTEVQLFVGEAKMGKGAQPATKANLRAAFEEVAKKARPQDVLMVYLAGHGTTLGLGTSVYVYPTAEADSPDFAKANMADKMITSDELAEWTKAISAEKQVLILDTCASGAAGAKLTEKRAPSGDQTRAIERLKDRVGYHVLMGCAADSISYEASRFNQGVLTYALLEGMKGPTRTAGKGVVGVDAWFAYAQKEVPLLAGALGGIQQPQIAAPKQGGKSEDFPIAQLDDQTAREVPLSPGGVLVVNPRVVDETSEDALNLEGLLKNALQSASLGQLQSGGQTLNGLTYVPVEELPGAWRISGLYEVEGEQVKLNLSLHSDTKVITRRTLTGRRDALPELAERAVALLRNTTLDLNLTSSPTTSAAPRRKARSLEANGAALEASTSNAWFHGTPLPAGGEIALAGAVDLVDADKHRLTLRVVAFQLPSGKMQLLTPPKTKLVVLPAGTEAEDWQTGDALVAIGRDLGKGQVLPPRLLVEPGESKESSK